MNLFTKLCLNQRLIHNVAVRKLNILPIEGLRLYPIVMILLLGLSMNHRVQACSLQFTSPVRGSTVSTAQVGVSGTGTGTANSGDQGQVTAYLNGVPFFSQSGTFTTLINFLGSGAASVTLQKGANTLSVSGSVNGCSASDSMVVYYQPTPPIEQKNAGEPEICNGTNPVNDATGNKFQQELDYQGGGRFPLQFIRYYNSAYSDVRALGKSWRHNYERGLYFNSAKTEAYIIRPSGQAYRFSKSGSIWISDADINDRFIASTNAGGSITGWRLYKSEDNSFEYYDTDGRLITLVDLGGMSQDLSYDAGGRLSSVTDRTSQRSLSFSYDSKNRLTSVTDPNGNGYTYSYDSTGRLVQVTPPDAVPGNPGRQYLYNEQVHTSNTNLPYALTGILDENGSRYATYRYDAQGRGIATEHAGGSDLHQLAYNADGSTTITDALGQPRTFLHQTILGFKHNVGQSQPAGSGCAASASSISYDANGNVASRTDFNGNLSCYAYDLNRNLETVRVEGLAPGSTCPSDLAAYAPSTGGSERKTATQWHTDYRLPTQIDETGRRTTFGYDANGNLLNKTIIDTATQQSRSWNYTYNSLGQVLTEDGPRTDVNDVTSYTYYADTTADHKPGDLQTVTNALGHVTTFTAYDANGRLLRLADPNGLVINFTYDARGRLTHKTVDGHTTIYDYDNVGNLIKITRPSGAFYNFTYDAAHRLTDIQDALGGKIHYTLDAMGNRNQEDIKDAQGHIVKTHSRAYDTLNRLYQDIGAYNQTIQYAYDANGNLTQITDAEGHSTQRQYDTLDRLIRSTDALNGQTDYDYDTLDRLVQVTDANNHGTIYSYNGLGDLTQLDSPNTGVTQYAYDSAGNLAQKTDAENITATYQYDAINRLLGIDYPGTEADVVNDYDTTPLFTWNIPQLGRLTSTRRGSSPTHYIGYDRRGNIAYTTATALANPYYYDDRIGYLYNADDQVSEVQFNWYRQHRYHYDQAGQIDRISVHDWDDGDFSGSGYDVTRVLADNIVHLPFGPVTGLTYGNGLTLNRNYDQDYRLAGQSVGNQLNLAYGYDANGNLQTATDLLAAANDQSYSYDGLNRLIAANGTAQQSYQYDPVGNRLANDLNGAATQYQYDLGSQKLFSQTGAHPNTVVSNAVGNITHAGGKTYLYAPDQRLASVKQGSADIARYSYDAQGRRRSKTVGTTTTHYDYDLQGRLLGEDRVPGDYVYLDGEPLARVDYNLSDWSGNVAGWNIAYYHNNPLGAPLQTTDRLGQISWNAQLDPFGKAAPLNPAITQNLRFPGQYYDQETGLHYNMARYYDPGIGRYLQSDPIGLSGGINTYTYVRNNPLKYIDPKGTFFFVPILGYTAINALADLALIGGTGYAISNAMSCKNEAHGDDSNKPNLLDPTAEDHILNGDKTGGGHRAGTGKPGKSEFPTDWSDDKIKGEISDVATDPTSSVSPGRNGRQVVEGTRDGIDITVIVDSNGRIVTGFPTNVPRNPR
jgi:RHS repeat-associated protein